MKCFRHVLPCVITALLPALSGVEPSLAQPAGDPANRLEFSRIVLRSLTAPDGQGTPAAPGKAVALSVSDEAALEIQFIGAPRWFNELEIRTDAPRYRVEVWSPEKERDWVEFVGEVRREGDRVFLSGADTYARGIRFVPLAAPAGRTVAIAELVQASFYQLDPDDVRKGVISPMTEEGTKECHVGWSNDYPGTIDDLSSSDDDAEELNNDLPNTWTKWLHADLNNHEVHYKNSGIGNGDNNNHTDAADLSFYVGHGTSGTFMIGNANEDDAYLYNFEAVTSWGNNDMEWLGSPACEWLESASRAGWHDAMDGLHLLCGSETISRGDPLFSYGGKWASKMKDSGAFDTAKTIKASWFDAYEAENPSGRVAIVIGETSTQGDDYLWGEGSVSADPVHDGTYNYWRHTASGLRPWAADVPAPALGRQSEGTPDPVHYAPPGGLPITLDRSLLASPAIQLPYYMVNPAGVDTPFVRNLAHAICLTEGVLCGGDIGPGDEDEVNLIDGLFDLRVCSNTGAFHYEDRGRWLAWRTQAPNLPNAGMATQIADQKLNAWGRRPEDAVFHDVRYVRQGSASHPEGQEIDDPQISFPIAIQVVYQRRLGMQQIPVEGGGGYMSVALGHNGQLQRVFQPGWHPVVMGAPVDIIPVANVVQALANRGIGATVDGISPPPQSVTIHAWRLAYYEPPCGVPVQRLRPIYVFDVTVNDVLGHATPSQIYAWADEITPLARITAPSGPVAVPVGAQVCVQGQVSGGVPPIVLTWKDDLGHNLGSGAALCFPALLPPTGSHSAGDSIRTVELTARDALGTLASDRVRIQLTPATSAVGPTAPVSIQLRQNVPNPFSASTRIGFHVPGTGPGVPTSLRVFDVVGRLVVTLIQGDLAPGDHAISWPGLDGEGHPVAPGIYFYELRAGNRVSSRKLLVAR